MSVKSASTGRWLQLECSAFRRSRQVLEVLSPSRQALGPRRAASASCDATLLVSLISLANLHLVADIHSGLDMIVDVTVQDQMAGLSGTMSICTCPAGRTETRSLRRPWCSTVLPCQRAAWISGSLPKPSARARCDKRDGRRWEAEAG
jgi:hypothetical protein